uniref:Uncharacterized protein n=1 Tax=Eutreptiella gymnastica TaxID=73025 RepID=A0A7S1I1R5_9EUGL
MQNAEFSIQASLPTPTPCVQAPPRGGGTTRVCGAWTCAEGREGPIFVSPVHITTGSTKRDAKGAEQTLQHPRVQNRWDGVRGQTSGKGSPLQSAPVYRSQSRHRCSVVAASGAGLCLGPLLSGK